MSTDKPIPPLPPLAPQRPLEPARHIAPAAHSEAAAHAAQDAGMDKAAQQAAAIEETGRDAMAHIEGADPVTHPETVTQVMPEAPRRRRKRVRRPVARKKK